MGVTAGRMLATVARLAYPVLMSSPLSDDLARQYESWVYPRPITDLSTLPAQRRDAPDPSVFGRLFWPDRQPPAEPDILLAGCGANQAAVVAYKNPKARVVGIDVSQASLANSEMLKQKHGLSNLELLRLPIEEVGQLGRQFDVVGCTGVLHHMADPVAGTRALGEVLKPDGVAALMLYAKKGRVGIEMLQQMFRGLGLGRDPASLAIVRETLQRLPPKHPARALYEGSQEMTFDGGLVDLFLNARERSYSVPELLELLNQAGLQFQSWLDNSHYYPELWFETPTQLYQRISGLPEPEVWAAMELALATEIDRHFFIACRADRPAERFRPDFASPSFLDAVPMWANDWAPGERDGRPGLFRGKSGIPLGEAQVPLARAVDGARPVRVMLSVSTEQFAREFFRVLWRAGMIWMGLPRR